MSTICSFGRAMVRDIQGPGVETIQFSVTRLLWIILSHLLTLQMHPSALSPDMKNCNEQFMSSTKSGTFVSPNHPDYYPSGVECRYTFRGDSRERVRISFTAIDLFYTAGDSSDPVDCTNQDSITVETSISPSSSGSPYFEKIGSYCGSKIPPNIMSAESILRVTFVSKEHSIATGFKAKYSFVTDYGLKVGEQDESKACKFLFRSSRLPSGTITSPNYPGLYPKNTECRYEFSGKTDERVIIKFNFFDVEGIPPDCKLRKSDYIELSNLEMSSAMTSVTVEPPSRICGSQSLSESSVSTGPVHRTIRSTTNQFVMTLKSDDKFDGLGFEASFKFQKAEAEEQPEQYKSSAVRNQPEVNLLAVFTMCTTVLHIINCIKSTRLLGHYGV